MNNRKKPKLAASIIYRWRQTIGRIDFAMARPGFIWPPLEITPSKPRSSYNSFVVVAAHCLVLSHKCEYKHKLECKPRAKANRLALETGSSFAAATGHTRNSLSAGRTKQTESLSSLKRLNDRAT